MPFVDHYRGQSLAQLEQARTCLASLKAELPLNPSEVTTVNSLLGKVDESAAAKKGLHRGGVDPNNFLI